ncbi:MAG: TetR family transcriptional regulator [Solirubrobacterales bacterium]
MTQTAGRPTHAEASRALLRETILDAVGELLADDSWAGVTMSQVATRAGVSRQTVYNTFGGRDELAQTYLLRESERFLAAIDEAITENAADARQALRSAAELFLELAATHPMIRAVASGNNDDLVALATTRGGLLLTTMTARLADRIERTWPGVDPAGASLLAENLVRLAISYAVLPSDTPEQTAEQLQKVLGPYIDQLVDGMG